MSEIGKVLVGLTIAGAIYVYFNDDNSSQEVDIPEDSPTEFVSSSSLDEVDSDGYSKKEKIQACLKGANSRGAYTVSKGFIFRKAKYSNGYFVFVYECDEDLLDIDIDEFRNNVYDNDEDLAKELRRSLSKKVRKYIKELSYGVELKYVGTTTGKTCSVRISKNLL